MRMDEITQNVQSKKRKGLGYLFEGETYLKGD